MPNDKEIVFNPNPFLRRAFYIEPPFEYVENWVSKEFGFKSFKSGRKADRFIYFVIGEDLCVKATPEFLDDTTVARMAFSGMKEQKPEP